MTIPLYKNPPDVVDGSVKKWLHPNLNAYSKEHGVDNVNVYLVETGGGTRTYRVEKDGSWNQPSPWPLYENCSQDHIRDFLKRASLPVKSALADDGAVGMADSTRCSFCGEFYEKAKPFICPPCWEHIGEVVTTYPDHFRAMLAE